MQEPQFALHVNFCCKYCSDHVCDRPELGHVLTHTISIDSQLAIDDGMSELRAGYIFLLASDGI